MKKLFSLILVLFISLVITFSYGFGQEPTNTKFKLSGEHAFKKRGAKNWTVSQQLIDEKTGESTINDNFAQASGEKAKFRLEKIENRETIYDISANGSNLSQKYRVRVFEPNSVSSFFYKTEANPPVRTFIFVPKSASHETKVLLVMHGLSRTAHNYIRSWETWAGENDYIVIAPKFDNENWKGSRYYNLGNMLTNDGEKRSRSKWSFQIVQDLYKLVKKGFGLKTKGFDIFGHSAGGQFVHRFMFFMPEAKVRVAIATNSGWYTSPDLDEAYPYGYKHARFSFDEKDLIRYSTRNVILLRGTDDTERTEDLRQSAEADAQGKNRYERAGFMFDKIKSINPDTKWRLMDVPHVGHDQRGMAAAAQRILEKLNSSKTKAEK